MDVVSVKDLAEKNNNLPVEVILELALREYGDRYIETANGQYLISRSKVEELKSKLAGITKFTEACLLLSKNAIPDFMSRRTHCQTWLRCHLAEHGHKQCNYCEEGKINC